MSTEKFNICIVEDSNIVTFLLKKMVKYLETPSELLCFDNGEPALEYLEKQANLEMPLPDVIFMDIHMPIMDGWEFAEAMQGNELLADIPMYIVSASVDPEDERRAAKYPCIKGYLPKPLTPYHINDIIKAIKSGHMASSKGLAPHS